MFQLVIACELQEILQSLVFRCASGQHHRAAGPDDDTDRIGERLVHVLKEDRLDGHVVDVGKGLMRPISA